MKKHQLQSFLFMFICFVFMHGVALSSEKVEVFVSIPPQKWICEHVGKELVKTSILVDNGQEPHTFEPRPKQILAFSRASLFFGVGLEFEQELIRRLGKNSPNLYIVDTTEGIHRIPMEMPDHGHRDHRKGEINHGHGVTLDPHVWLSPRNLKIMAAAMAEALASEDPAHRRNYENNLAELNRKLDDLDQKITGMLAPFHNASFFVFHPAFGYFADSYHLQQVAVETGGKSPTPRQLSVLIRRARDEGVKVIFVQSQFDPKSANAVAAAIGGKVVALDPLAEDVEANLKIMAERIVQALLGQEKR
ncbi:MAG: zinc ABC transporter substrate-binding protein [Proteobacteria bacterium]|nr:zinc ABC transporter substrate-binding protein [Pseudomonadota bacterium]MBU1140263.1 zinc ABC transporter substrate-binding protein [Pseudomonadota bacterium]MBU1233523.1 zinc ABC transporter substrate-binding protein [Pseudomonadota bacterium]MBU1417812.1 zinc ABC transporter substrate-binding protein [Pseudomonadota bacterium]MBU1453160.1 zinc ABC transporter substrate-binding protein [Pseudomonadota bacterium]